MIELPPSEAGGLKLMVACLLAAVAVALVGAPGTVADGASLTRLTEAVLASVPDAPVIVNPYVPGAVAAGTVTDSVDVRAAGSLTGFGLKLAVAPAGRPVTLNSIEPLNPLLRTIAIV